MVLVSPRAPRPGEPLRVVAVSDGPSDGVLQVAGPDGTVLARSAEQQGGPPFFRLAKVAQPAAGSYRAWVDGAGAACATFSVGGEVDVRPALRWGSVWPVREQWGRGWENVYSAWIQSLFDAPLADQPTWPVLHDVLRDRERNFLHDHLGLGEDDPARHAPRIDPDCADLPYFLRAYFAFKVGLPFGFSRCTRGGPGGPPRCHQWTSSVNASKVTGRNGLARFGNFLAVDLANAIHSGAVRAVATDDAGDFYPVTLRAETLRPGTIYADPYGHILMIVRRVAQPPAEPGAAAPGSGLLLAVDGQPDGTVARRRFWRGNFLFSDDASLGSPGFKRFRPVVLEERSLRPLGNEEIAEHPEYGDFSLEQYQLGVDGFYDRMEDVLSPAPIEPARALAELLDALEEQVTRRVLSVQNGVDYVAAHRGAIDMPKLGKLFETEGPWEDFATPSRDMRLLIAIEVVRSFPARIARRPQRYVLPTGKTAADAQADATALLALEAAKRRFSYVRSNGSKQELTLADVLARQTALEVAYNPNDCAEIRWGAPAGSAELGTCTRRAPADQRAAMERHRSWFAQRRRPPREP